VTPNFSTCPHTKAAPTCKADGLIRLIKKLYIELFNPETQQRLLHYPGFYLKQIDDQGIMSSENRLVLI
jgi:hypothetical protein